jgi:hypothetical protein
MSKTIHIDPFAIDLAMGKPWMTIVEEDAAKARAEALKAKLAEIRARNRAAHLAKQGRGRTP